MSKHILEPINESEIELTQTLASSYGKDSAKELTVSCSQNTDGFLYTVTSHNIIKHVSHSIDSAVNCYNGQP